MSETFEIIEGYESLLQSRGLASLGDVFAWDTGVRLDKPGLECWRQRWRICLNDREGMKTVLYLKRFDRPPFRRQAERWRLGHPWLSTAAIEWHNAQQLAAAGVAAVRPAAYAERMRGPWESRSFVLLTEVVGESLERWLPVHVPPMAREMDPVGRRHLLDGLARFVGRFHRAGFVHRDLYLSHVFIQPNRESGAVGETKAEPRFCLIDLQRVFRPRMRHRRWVVKDLAQLNYSTPLDRVGLRERLRFLCRYVRECDRFGSARLLAQLVAGKTARMARRTPMDAAGMDDE